MNEHTSTLLVMLLVEFHSRECPLSFQDHMEFIVYNYPTIHCMCIYTQVSQEEWTKLRESVPYVKIYRYNPKHLYPKLNVYGDNGHGNLQV